MSETAKTQDAINEVNRLFDEIRERRDAIEELELQIEDLYERIAEIRVWL